MNQARYWVCEESVHEESHEIGPAPIICRRPAASVKATRRIPAFPHMSRCPLLVEFALATLKIALNAWNSTFLLPLLMEFGAAYLWTPRAQKWPL